MFLKTMLVGDIGDGMEFLGRRGLQPSAFLKVAGILCKRLIADSLSALGVEFGRGLSDGRGSLEET